MGEKNAPEAVISDAVEAVEANLQTFARVGGSIQKVVKTPLQPLQPTNLLLPAAFVPAANNSFPKVE
jgi:hypothetical protein